MSLATSPTPSALRNFRRNKDSFNASAWSCSSSTFISRSWSNCSLTFIALNYASFKVGTRHELRLDRKLLGGQIEGFAGEFDIDALDLVQNPARFDDRYPVIRSTFTRAHT